jgi:2-phospho-L-lactate guanylyltransferase
MARINLVSPESANAEVKEIYEKAPQIGSVLAPAQDRRGTNAVLRRPAALFPLRFGNDSFVPHLAAAKATGESCVVLSLAGIGLDIDTPEDLRALALAAGDKRSQALARRLLKTAAGFATDEVATVRS